MGKTLGILTVALCWLVPPILLVSTSGCDQLQSLSGAEKDTDEDEDETSDDDADESDGKKKKNKKKKKKKSDDETAEGDDPAPTQPASEPTADAVTTYPEQKEASGSYKLLKALKVRSAAEESASERVELGIGTRVEMKATHQGWSLITFEKPSDSASEETGWVNAEPSASDTFESVSSPEPAPDPSPTQPDPAPGNPAQPPTTPSPTTPKPTTPQPSSQPPTKPTATAPKVPTLPCGCKAGDLACAMKCAQKHAPKPK